MTEYSIRDLHSDKPVKPLFCMVNVDGEKVELVLKEEGRNGKKYRTISLEDFEYQIDIAKTEERQKRNYRN